MLYILPPPQTAKPPSVWDLILNFHRKGCPDSDASSFVPLKKAKLPLRFAAREQSWCNKTTVSSCQTASHVSNIGKKERNIRLTSKKKSAGLWSSTGSVSLSREIARQANQIELKKKKVYKLQLSMWESFFFFLVHISNKRWATRFSRFSLSAAASKKKKKKISNFFLERRLFCSLFFTHGAKFYK